MNQKTINVNNVKNMTGRMAAEKKKLFIAIALISVMVVMWTKVFTKKSTVSQAAADSALAVQQKTARYHSITYVPLPVVPGRNDILKRNIFAFGNSGAGSGRIGMGRDRENIAKIENDLKLDAVITGDNPSAFIDNKLVSVGSTLPITYENQTYEFVVTKITENTAFLKWNDYSIRVKMAQPVVAE